MKRILIVSALALTGLLGSPAPASADITFFLGFHPQGERRSVRGAAVGVNMLIFGFEFDYAQIKEDPSRALPGLQTGMFNMLVMTPTNMQLYVTAGAGLYRESMAGAREINFGTNFGGGVKIPLFGPIRVRVDYRVFTLRSSANFSSKPQRIYVGVNWAF